MIVNKKITINDNKLVEKVNFDYTTESPFKDCYTTVFFKKFTFVERLKLAWKLLFSKFNSIQFKLTNEHHATLQGVATYLKPKSTNKKAK